MKRLQIDSLIEEIEYCFEHIICELLGEILITEQHHLVTNLKQSRTN